IVFNTGKSLTITNCVIRYLTNTGVLFRPNASSSLSVSDTLAADNGFGGILVEPSGSGIVQAVFNRVETYNNTGDGLTVSGQFSTGTINASVTDSVAANNSSGGFRSFSPSGQATTSFMVVRSVAANNGVVGVSAGNSSLATLRIGQSALTGNA